MINISIYKKYYNPPPLIRGGFATISSIIQNVVQPDIAYGYHPDIDLKVLKHIYGL